MTSEMSTEARGALAALREDQGPGDADRDRVRAKLAVRIAAGAAAGAIVSTVAGSAKTKAMAAGLLSSWTAKGVLSTLALSIVGAGMVAVATSDGTRSGSTRSGSDIGTHAPSRARVEAVGSSPVSGPTMPSALPPAFSSAATDSHAPVAAPPGAARSAGTGSSGLRLRNELGGVEAAYGALRDGDPARALVLSSEPMDGGSLLAEERALVRVLALCKLGRKAESEAAGRAFAAQFPASPLRARASAVCVPPPRGTASVATEPSTRPPTP